MNAFGQIPDSSDQSISDDEEDLNDHLQQNCVSLLGASSFHINKQVLQIQSQLEIAQGTHTLNHATKPACSSNESDEDKLTTIQNEAGFICSPRKASMLSSDEEMISDDEENIIPSNLSVIPKFKGFGKVHSPSFVGQKHCGSSSWSEVTKEAEALNRLNESKPNAPWKGSRVKAKHKLSFRFQSRKEEIRWSSVLNDKREKLHFISEAIEPVALQTAEHSMAELLEDYRGERMSDSETSRFCVGVGDSGHGVTDYSMTELFDGLQEKTGLLKSNYKKNPRTKVKTRQLGYKKNTTSLGDRNMNDEDPPEALSCGTSSDEDMNNQNIKPIIPEKRKQTMAEQFHEVLGAASVNNEGLVFAAPKSSDSGLFARLQQVMHIQKERELDLSRKLQAGDEADSIVVKILSKYLDAKLIVCQCTFREYKECYLRPRSFQPTPKNIEGKRTIIFNSKARSNAELEVGNLIRIYPPWKEVSVSGNDECMVLSSYFSQIMT